MRFKRFWVGLRLGIVLVVLLLVFVPDWPVYGDSGYRLGTIVGEDRRFDFLVWEMEAFETKARVIIAPKQDQLSEDERRQQVLSYLDDIHRSQVLGAQIEHIYSDPDVADPQSESAATQAELDTLRADLAARQPTAEAIVQQQVASVLADEGFGVAGVTFPPVLMNMTPLPEMLIISPRDRIEQVDYATLVPDISTVDKDAIEDAVHDQLDLSALVVPIGGMGTYPAMISETSDVNWLAEVVSHEWTHHWLSLRPVGMRYLQDGAMRTINETVASLVDLEIGPEVIARYYPAFVPPPVEEKVSPLPPTAEADSPAFDFSAEMAVTRNHVDELLAAGQIDEAEAYMEARRQVFWDAGYQIRKLNQAYFAFYGGYAVEPGGGAAGRDPIGPMLREIRAASPSLHAFLTTIGRVTSFEDLQQVYRDVVGKDPAELMTP